MKLEIRCPFCESNHPIPLDFDLVYHCECGACYKVCSGNNIENSMVHIASEIWNDDELAFLMATESQFCDVVIERDFDRLINLKQELDDTFLPRFCNYDEHGDLNLVWIKREN